MEGMMAMMDKLENFINGLTDMDWGWWPVLFLRPPKDQEMDDRMLLKLTFVFGSLVGALFMLALLLVGTGSLTFGDMLLFIVFCLFLGWTLFFVVYKLTFAYFWNRRARRLRSHQGRGMRVHIYKLRRGAKDWVIDEKHPVAIVSVIDGQGSFQFYDRSWEAYLRKLFTEPASAFRGGERTPDGVFVDAFVTYPAWTREALELIVSDKLRASTLGGRIIDDGADAAKPSSFREDRPVKL
jgi:hypothetical protein